MLTQFEHIAELEPAKPRPRNQSAPDSKPFEKILGGTIEDLPKQRHFDDRIQRSDKPSDESTDTNMTVPLITGHGFSTDTDGTDNDRKKPSNNIALGAAKGKSGNPDYSGYSDNESSLSLSKQEIEELVRVLQRSAVEGKNCVTFVVRSETLGDVELTMSIAGKTIFVRARTETDEAAEILQNEGLVLAAGLRDLGLKLGEFDVRSTLKTAPRSVDQMNDGVHGEQKKVKPKSPKRQKGTDAGQVYVLA